jgi:hypothetical protein
MRPLFFGTLIALASLACYNPNDNLTAATSGTITGTVGSNTGAVGGVTLTDRPQLGSGQSTVSNRNGQYTINSVPFGPGSVAVSGVPSGCETGGSGYSMPPSLGTITVNITIQCGITTGTVDGVISTTAGGTIAGAIITVTPTGGHALPTVTSDASGSYADPMVPASPSSGTVTLSGLPAGCTAPAPVAYSGLTVLGAVTANFVVSCQITASAIGLWVDGQYLLSAAQLAQSGSPTPADSCPGYYSSISGGLGPEAFDANGNLWTARTYSSADTLIMWTASQLAGACSPAKPAVTVSFTTIGDISALAFDSHGTLWMSTTTAIYGVSATQLGAGSAGGMTPRYTIGDAQQAGGLAFDTSGNLWVANSASVIEYTAAQLAAATTGSTASAPSHVLTDSAGTSSATYNYVAFDAHGNLWVSVSVTYQAQLPGDTVYTTQYADSVLEFSASQLANLASNSTPTPVVSLGESIAQDNTGIIFGAIAFDADGNLWLGLSGANGGGSAVRYPAANLSGNRQSDITVTSPNGTAYGYSLAFNPTPAGLPINGSHVTTHVVQAKGARQRYR